MPERHEHSYYEISLTSAQMVVAFVLVLGCLIAAFFAGIYVGRDGSMSPPVMAQTDANAEEPPAEETETAAGPDAFDFFSEGEPEEAPPEPREIAEQADPSTTLLEDVNGTPEPRQQAPAEPPAEAPTAQSTSPAADEPEAPPAGPAEQQESAPAAAATSEGGLVIQVFSSDSYEQAQQVLERLRGGGMPAYLSPVEVNGRTMHRVRIGPYSERAQTEQIAQRVRRDYQLDTWITQGD